jgi:uncharacterized protein YndB with AHSA1/START domain
MSTALEKMQVQVNDRELVFTRIFDAPRQMVWDAWTKKEHLEKWWGPHGFTNKECRVDLRPGGEFRDTMVGMGGEYPCHFIYHEIVPIEKIVWTDKVVEGDFWGPDGPPPDSVLTMLFEDLGSKTKLTMISKFETNEGRDKILKMGAAQGWAESLEKLDVLLAE